MDQIEIEFSCAPVMFTGEDLWYFSADNGMKTEAFEFTKELDRL